MCPGVCEAESSRRRARLKVADLLAFKALVRADPRLPPPHAHPRETGPQACCPELRAAPCTCSNRCLLTACRSGRGGAGDPGAAPDRPWLQSPREEGHPSCPGQSSVQAGRGAGGDVDLDPLLPGCPHLGLLRPGAAPTSGPFCARPRPPQHLHSLQPCSEPDIAR